MIVILNKKKTQLLENTMFHAYIKYIIYNHLYDNKIKKSFHTSALIFLNMFVQGKPIDFYFEFNSTPRSILIRFKNKEFYKN
jgi:hypothetical protein